MAARFWVGGTGTWDAADTTHWAATSGGAGGASVPGSADDVTFNGSSGGGTVTVNFGGTITLKSLTAGAFTGTLDFATNNNPVTFADSAGFVTFSGSGTRTINMGSGTWTIAGTSGTPFDVATVTGLTASFASAPLVFTSTSGGTRQFQGGAQSYGSLTVNSNTSKGAFICSGANTFASVTVGSGNLVAFATSVTTTITGALAITGTSSLPVGLQSTSNTSGAATVSVGSASTLNWASITNITKSGAGSITATDSLDLGRNTNVTINAPSGSGGVVGVIGG